MFPKGFKTQNHVEFKTRNPKLITHNQIFPIFTILFTTMQSILSDIKRIANSLFIKIFGFRHHLHQHPELSFHEYKTSHAVVGVFTNNQFVSIVASGKVAVRKGQPLFL
jgi:hypothetical protein